MGLFGSNEITGIDAGAGGIKAVRIKPGSRPKLTAASFIEFSPEAPADAVASGLRSLLSDKKINRKNVFTLMPGKDLTIRSISLPKMPLVELREAVRWEAKRHVSYPLDAAFVEFVIAGERREGAGVVDKYDVVLVAAEEAKIKERLQPFDEAGLSVTVIDANALALRNTLLQRNGRNAADILVVDIGAGSMEINIYKEGALRFSRCLETGGNDVTRLIAEHLNIALRDAESAKRHLTLVSASADKTVAVVAGRIDALLMEIRRSVEYYRTTYREKGVERVVLTGGTVLMKGLPEYFSAALGLPVELWNPFESLEGGEELGRELGPLAPRFSAAVGLALRRQ